MSTTKIIFECSKCGVAVTHAVSPLPEGAVVGTVDGAEAVPAGFCVPSDDDYWTGSAGHTLINMADLNGTRHHPDLRRNSGCCGRDGTDGPNLLCENGHEIGTERSDCWMSRAAVLFPQLPRRLILH